ncbi:MAG: NAD(P)-dependent oxidoreductase [Hyphomicrobiales bacterium]
MKGKVLFVDTTHIVLKEGLTELGYQCDFFDNYNYGDYCNVVSQYDGVIIRSKIKIDRNFIDNATNCKFIARVGAGLENIDVEYAETKGIYCLNSPEGNRDAVGEQAVGMLIMLMNNLIRADHEVRNLIWKRKENRGNEIKERTIGIIGYGNMGKAFAQRIASFGANIIAYDKYKTNFSDEFVKEVSLEELQRTSDIVSLHVPLTEETYYMVNSDFLNAFEKSVWLLNTARGPVVNTQDLTEAIENGKIIGAALDVLEYEKLGFESIKKDEVPKALEYLLKSDKVVLSPHIAGWTHESNYKLSKVIVDKVQALLDDHKI